MAFDNPKTPEERFDIVSRVISTQYPECDKGRHEKAMSISQACSLVGVPYPTYVSWLNRYPELKEFAQKASGMHLEAMRTRAMANVNNALAGSMKLKDKELVDVSLRFLEKTHDDFKDRKEVSVTGDFEGLSLEELIAEAKKLTN